MSTLLRSPVSVSHQAVALAAGTAVSQGLTALMYVVTARQADPRAFGAAVAAIAVGMAAAGLLDFGSNALWVRELASRRLLGAQLGTRALVKVGLTAALGLVWLVVAPVLEGSWTSAIAAPIALTTMISQTTSVAPRAAGRSELAAVAVVVDRTTACVVVLSLLRLLGAAPVTALWVGLTVGSLVGAATAWVLCPREFRFSRLDRATRNPWRGARGYGVSALASSGQTLDVTVLAAVGGSAAAGLYGAVNRWTQPMGLVVSAFSMASAPVVAAAASWEEAWRRVRGGLWLPALAVLGCVLVACAAPLLVPLILGSDYSGSSEVLRILALGTVPAVLNQPLAVFLQSRGHQRPVSLLFVGAVVFQLLLLAALAPRLGAVAGALALGCGQLLLLVGLVVLASRLAPGRRAVA